MEHTLRGYYDLEKEAFRAVLILVLVEHTLRAGRCQLRYHAKEMGLNPCFSGTYSQRNTVAVITVSYNVLILVLVEHTLRVI